MAPKTKTKTSTMPRAYASLTLMFGMVSIPISIRPLVGDRRSGVRGRMLCADHQQPVSQLWKCEEGDHVIERSECVTGYETAPDSGTYVVLDDAVIESLVTDREAAANVKLVVPTDKIDPIYYEKNYALWPQEGAGQPHDLFTAVLRQRKLSAIVTATISKQTRTFALRWVESLGCLVASLLFFDSDLRWEDGEIISASVKERSGSITDEHIAMARTLVESLLGEFDVSDVTDEYTDALREAIEAAAQGKAPAAAKPKTVQKAQADLLDTLKASVEATATAKKPATKAKPKAKTPA